MSWLLALTALSAHAGVVSTRSTADDPAWQPRRVAVLVGVQDYSDPALRGLRFPAQDARELGAVLGDEDVGAFDRVFVVEGGDNTTAAAIRDTIALATADLQRDDTFLLYLSGHGTLTLDPREGSRLWFLPSDGQLDDPEGTGLAIAKVEELVASLPARRRVLIMDTCHNGRTTDGPLAGRAVLDDRTETLLQGFRGEPPPPRGLREVSESEARLFAAQFHQPAMEDPNLENGVYTHFLIDALTDSKRQADLDGDGLVDVAEAHEHARDHTIRHTSGIQVPRAEYRIVGREEIYLSGDPSRRTSAEMALIGATNAILDKARLFVDGVPRGAPVGLTPVDPGAHRIELRDSSGERLASGRVRLAPGERMDLEGLFTAHRSAWAFSLGGTAITGSGSVYVPAGGGELELSWLDPVRLPRGLFVDGHLRAGVAHGPVAEQAEFPVTAGIPAIGLSAGARLGPARLGLAAEGAVLWRSFRDYLPDSESVMVEPRVDALVAPTLGPRLTVTAPVLGRELFLRADSRWMPFPADGSQVSLWQHGLALGMVLGR
jgi:uncharacterized caspase-like protein